LSEFLLAQKGFPIGDGVTYFLLIVLGIIALVVLAALAAAYIVGLVVLIRSKSVAVKVIIAGLMLLPPLLTIVWYVSAQPSRDYMTVKQAGFHVSGGKQTTSRYFQKMVVELEPTEWDRLIEESRHKQVLSPEQLAEILARHPELFAAELGPRSYQPVVMQTLAGMPKVWTVEVYSPKPLTDDWTTELPTANWSLLDINAPGLTPAAVVRILERSPQLRKFGIPQAAVDEAVCTALEEHPTIKEFQVYQMAGEVSLPDSIRDRLRKRFRYDFVVREQ
jgi:hypothetical protein